MNAKHAAVKGKGAGRLPLLVRSFGFTAAGVYEVLEDFVQSPIFSIAKYFNLIPSPHNNILVIYHRLSKLYFEVGGFLGPNARGDIPFSMKG